MKESVTGERHLVAAGDVYALNTTIAAFVMLVMSKDEVNLGGEHGPKVYFRWLAHPDANLLTRCDWIYESTINARGGNGEDVWSLIASAD